MKKTTKLTALLLALLTAVTLFTACSQAQADDGEEPDIPDPEPVEETEVKDTLVIAMESEPPTLHPFDHTAVTAGYMNALTYNALFRTDPETLKPAPDLCESWSQLDEATWEFKIFENVTFHDGTKMTSKDVAASMEYAKEYPTTKQYSSFWTNVEIVDDYTVRVTTNGAYALTLLDMASLKVVPAALIESGNDFNLNPVGAGPYKFVSQTLGDRIEFEAFDGYFDESHAPKIKYLTWRVIPEGSSRTIALEAGEVDFIVEVETTDLERLREAEEIEVQTVGGTRMNYFSMNNEVYPFNNVDFRKAVACAIDIDAVLTVALDGEGKSAQGACPSVYEGASNENMERYDPARAAEYLEKSGVDTAGLTFSCIVSNDITRRAAEVVQAYLGEIGVEMTIESLDYAAWLSDVMGGTYETAITGYTSASLARYLSGTFHSSALNAANQARVNDPHVDELIDLGLTQTDEALAVTTYRQLTAYINGLTPYVPLYESIVTRAYNAQLGGVLVSPSGNVRFEDVYWEE